LEFSPFCKGGSFSQGKPFIPSSLFWFILIKLRPPTTIFLA